MATVYLATDLRLERRVAIKIMHHHLADDEQFKERFIQEARSAARLAHPNVVNVFDQGQDSDMAYLVMEYLPGITLRDLLTEHRILTSEQTLDILEAVLSGLAAAHKAGIVHRDLKPENVLLADDGRIKIGDFGLARAASANTATGAALLGTIAYLSPELVTRGIADTRSDIYAVGIMMYEMLAGEQPFKGDQPMQIAYQHANDSVPTPSSKNPRVPAELDELVLWATAREPDERPKDARVMLEQLGETQDQLLTSLPSTALATVANRTMVLPPEVLPGSDAETQVIGRNGGRALVAATPAGPTQSLTALAAKRKSRGRLLVALVIVLAILAGTTGWYFGAGPGSTVTIPDSLAEKSVDDATEVLTDLGLVVRPATEPVFDPYIEKGLVVSSDPAAGESVNRGASVTLNVSDGPKPIDVPEFAGQPEDDVAALMTSTGFEVTDDNRIERFSTKFERGTVMGVYGLDSEGEVFTLKAGDTYFDRGEISLQISLGAVPNVAGMTLDEATRVLAESKLTAKSGKEVFSDTVEKGRVIGFENPDVKLRPGDTVVLTISRGPDLVAVPSVAGRTIADAIEELEKAGFAVDVRTAVDDTSQWDNPLLLVTKSDPAAGTEIKRGSTVTIFGVL